MAPGYRFLSHQDQARRPEAPGSPAESRGVEEGGQRCRTRGLVERGPPAVGPRPGAEGQEDHVVAEVGRPGADEGAQTRQ